MLRVAIHFCQSKESSGQQHAILLIMSTSADKQQALLLKPGMVSAESSHSLLSEQRKFWPTTCNSLIMSTSADKQQALLTKASMVSAESSHSLLSEQRKFWPTTCNSVDHVNFCRQATSTSLETKYGKC